MRVVRAVTADKVVEVFNVVAFAAAVGDVVVVDIRVVFVAAAVAERDGCGGIFVLLLVSYVLVLSGHSARLDPNLTCIFPLHTPCMPRRLARVARTTPAVGAVHAGLLQCRGMIRAGCARICA